MTKKIFSFLMCCLFVLGVIGGIGYTLYCGAWPVTVGVVALGFMAFPKVKVYFKNLLK